MFGVQFGAGDTGPQEASAFLGHTVSSVQETVWSICYMREIKQGDLVRQTMGARRLLDWDPVLEEAWEGE